MAMAMTSLTSTASRHLLQITKHGRARNSSTIPCLRIGYGYGGSHSNVPLVANNNNNNATTATARRLFADTAGLRRSKNSGRNPSTAFPKSQTSTSQGSADPHSIANERVSSAAFGQRTPGTESVATLTTEQKISNYAMASGLLVFVSYIFYYSLASVGGGEQAKALIFGGGDDASRGDDEAVNPGFEEFLKEAQEGRAVEEKRMKAEQTARKEASELAELESTTAARLKAQGMDDTTVAASASDEEEREMRRIAGFVDEGGIVSKRPLWKRIVFFWRRE